MKKTILITILVLLSISLFAQQKPKVTLIWLQQNIQNRDTLFKNKKLKVLFDSLKTYRQSIKDYLLPEDNVWGKPDTVKSNRIKIYFNEGFFDVSMRHTQSFFNHSQRTDTLNTHIPYIKIILKNKVPFLRKWYDEEKAGIGSLDWNKTLEVFWGRQIVDKIEVGEY